LTQRGTVECFSFHTIRASAFCESNLGSRIARTFPTSPDAPRVTPFKRLSEPRARVSELPSWLEPAQPRRAGHESRAAPGHARQRATKEEGIMTISQTTQELLKAAAGRGVSDDPALLTRSKVRLLQNVSKLPKHGRGAPGMFVLPDEVQTCATALRAVLGVIYPVWVERTENDKFVGERFVLPDDAEKDGYRWRLSGGNVLDREARIAGLFEGLEAELDLAKTSMRVARALNADAKARMKKLGLPLFGLSYEITAQEITNDRGQVYYAPVFTFLGGPADPGGPSEEEIIRASALCDIVEATVAEAKRELVESMTALAPGRMLITPQPQPKPALIDDDIPF
jgi:hypothetical protein